MRKLKACPYCGGEAQIKWPEITDWRLWKGVYINIRCDKCNAESGSVKALSGDENTVKFGFRELDRAIGIWNRDIAN